MRLEDFIPNQTFPDLQHVRVHPSSTSTIGLDAELSQILRRSPTLTQLDLHFTNASGFFQSSRRAPRKQDLFTVATRLTLHGCEFLYGLFRADVISCPSLRAMSVKNWRNNRVFINKLKLDELPFLRALSIKTRDYNAGDSLINLIRSLSSLRELIIRGPCVSFGDGSIIRQHADTLEILSLCCILGGSCVPRFDATSEALLRALLKLRLLNLYSPNTWVQLCERSGQYAGAYLNENVVRLIAFHRAL
jgi:hypothetical protein